MTDPLYALKKVSQSASNMFIFEVDGSPIVDLPAPYSTTTTFVVEKIRVTFGDGNYQYMVLGGRVRSNQGALSGYTEKNLPAAVPVPDWALPYTDLSTCLATTLSPTVQEA